MKMIKKLAGISVLGFALSAPQALAAPGPLSVAIKGGMGLSKTNETTATMGTGFMGGLGLDIGAGPIGFQVDALYAVRKIGFPLDTSVSMNQIVVPAQLRFALMPMFRITAGGYLAYGMGDISTKVGTAAAVPVSYALFNREQMDFGLVGGLGFKLGPVLLEARYLYGLQDLDTTATSSKFSSFDVLAGFVF